MFLVLRKLQLVFVLKYVVAYFGGKVSVGSGSLMQLGAITCDAMEWSWNGNIDVKPLMLILNILSSFYVH